MGTVGASLAPARRHGQTGFDPAVRVNAVAQPVLTIAPALAMQPKILNPGVAALGAAAAMRDSRQQAGRPGAALLSPAEQGLEH